MPPGIPKKAPIEDLAPEAVEVPVQTVAPLERALARQAELLALREAMTSEGIDSISKLDALLSQANEEVRKLN